MSTLSDLLQTALNAFATLDPAKLSELGHDVESDHHDQAVHELPAIAVKGDGVMEGLNVTSCPCLKYSHLAPATEGKVRGIVWHFTNTNGVPGSAIKLAVRLQDPKNKRPASWHILVGRDGLIIQSVPLTLGSWHAGSDTASKFELVRMTDGKLKWRMSPTGKVGANALFCGIEMENVGEVRKGSDGKWRGWPYEKGYEGVKGPVVDVAQIVEYHDPKTGKVTHWQNFTQEQEDAAERLVRAIVAYTGATRDQCEFGHVDIDPSRRSDPGPIWATQFLPRILDKVFAA